MELFQTLPLARGYEVKIPFYEAGPGQDEPKFYSYCIQGEDDRSGLGPDSVLIAKKTQLMIREQTKLKDGTIFGSLLTSDIDAAHQSP